MAHPLPSDTLSAVLHFLPFAESGRVRDVNSACYNHFAGRCTVVLGRTHAQLVVFAAADRANVRGGRFGQLGLGRQPLRELFNEEAQGKWRYKQVVDAMALARIFLVGGGVECGCC